MKKFIFAAMAALAVIASSCYEDKGNYDYHDVNLIDSVKFHWNSSAYDNLSIGDTAHLIARVVFSNPKENVDDWKYIWKLNNEEVAEGMEYDYIPTKMGTDYLQFYVEHKKSGMRYYLSHPALSVYSGSYISVAVKSPFYAGGWHILSKKEDNSTCVDVLLRQWEYPTFINEDGEEDYWIRYYYNEYKDIYYSFNGEEIGTNPTRLYRYYPVFSNAGPEILVMQGTNNNDAVFLDKDDFHKVLTLKEEFENDEYPNNSYVTEFWYGGSSNWSITADGKLYAVVMGETGGSSNITAFSHIYNFLTTPLELGEASHAKRFMSELSPYITKAAIVYDSGLNTYLFFYTDTNTGTSDHGLQVKGSSITLKVNGTQKAAADYFPTVLADYEALEWCFTNGKASSGPHYVMGIKKHKQTGELVYDYFDYKGTSKKVAINVYEENVPMPEGVTENTPWTVNRVNKYFWYAVGNKIMFYDPATKESRLYTTADSEVTAMQIGPCSDTRQKNQLVVGFANKEVIMYNIDATILQIAATKGDAKEYGDNGMGDSWIYWKTTATGVPMQIQTRHKYMNQEHNNKMD